MKRILVATDFSERSDRAIRRAVLLARQFDAVLSLAHVVDDDQPTRIVGAERDAAAALMVEQARSLNEVEGVRCEPEIVLGDPYLGIAEIAEARDADLLVLGPHRRLALKDVFVGTTAERVIRAARRPILMANGVPAGFHRHALVAVDLSAHSAAAVRAVMALGLERHMAVSVVHVFEAPGTSLLVRGAVTDAELDDFITKAEARAAGEVAGFLAALSFAPARLVMKFKEGSYAGVIRAAAQEAGADLIVAGTRGQTGVAKLLLGSVAEELLRIAEQDVLVVPAAAG